MNKDRLILLYRKFKDQTISAQEWEELQAELKKPEVYDLLSDELDGKWGDFTDQQLSALEPERFEKVYDQIVQHQGRSAKVTRLWLKLAGVAAAVALIVFGVYFFNTSKQAIPSSSDVYVNDVAPGKVGATLTLASGKKIRLSDAANGELAKEAGVFITKSADGKLIYELKGAAEGSNKINTLSTSNGETYQLRLPDGSLVDLNAASSLTYSAALVEGGKRVVELRGEGYFQVAKDKAHPFIVKTSSQQVEVLGTHFNINAYGDESAVKTTLLEGSVKVNPSEINQGTVILKPNQQSLVSGSARIAVQDVDPEEAVAWRNGEFVFAGDDFRAVMRKIARWYDVEVIYKTNPPADFELGGVVSRLKNVSVVLKRMEETGDVHFKIEGRRIYVVK